MADDKITAELGRIRANHEATGGPGGNASDPVPRLLAALEAVLKLADPEKSTGVPPIRINWAITAALAGEEAGDGR